MSCIDRGDYPNNRVPTVLLDVCDVVAALHDETIRILDLEFIEGEITSWDMFERLTERDANRVKSLWNEGSFWRDMPLIEGAQDGVWALQDAGFRVHWITSPWFTCPDWENIRRRWLGRNFGVDPAHDVTITTQKGHFFGDVFVDDRPKHIKAWQRAFPGSQAWLFDSPLNCWFDWPRRCVWGKDGLIAI